MLLCSVQASMCYAMYQSTLLLRQFARETSHAHCAELAVVKVGRVTINRNSRLGQAYLVQLRGDPSMATIQTNEPAVRT